MTKTRNEKMLLDYILKTVCVYDVLRFHGESINSDEWEERCLKYFGSKAEYSRDACLACIHDWLMEDRK